MSLPQPPKRDSSRFDDWMFTLWKSLSQALDGMASITVGGGSNSTGSFTLGDGTYLVIGDTWTLTGTNVATLSGSSTLTIV